MLHSRSQRSSPTHTIGFKPEAKAAFVLLLTVSSVSPKYCLLSLWPKTTYSTPISLSIGAEISPVKAPLSAQWQFSAPIFTFVPFVVSRATYKSTKGTQAITSQSASLTAGITSSRRTLASAGVLFIFQLPAIIAFLFALSIINRPFVLYILTVIRVI